MISLKKKAILNAVLCEHLKFVGFASLLSLRLG